MKKLLFSILVFMFASGCAAQPTTRALDQFNMNKGAARVYYYQSYQPSGTDPTKTIKATFQLSETVVDRQVVPSYVIAHVQRELKLINADLGWPTNTADQTGDIWYVFSGHQVYSQKTAIDVNHILLSELTLSYDFPLSVGKNWCPLQYDPKDSSHTKITDCRLSGEREVISHGDFMSMAGTFNDCYDMIDHFNGGSIFQKFCTGVGVVSLQFDHMGTKFGFSQSLSSYLIGTP